MPPTRTARARTISADKAVVPASLSHEDLMALLGQTGAIPQGGTEYHRLTLKGGMLVTDDGEIFPPKKDGPAMTVRIVKPPVYYNAFYLTTEEGRDNFDATAFGRADLNGRFCRKYDDPAEQQADTNPANELFDQIAAATGQRGSFKADVQVQIVPPSGELTGDETVYTLTLSTTSVFEWRGSTRDKEGGSVSEFNFMVKLAKFAQAQAEAAGADEIGQKKAILDAMTSLRLGGVIADLYPLQAEDKNRTWTVIAWEPVHVEPPDGGAPAIAAGDDQGF